MQRSSLFCRIQRRHGNQPDILDTQSFFYCTMHASAVAAGVDKAIPGTTFFTLSHLFFCLTGATDLPHSAIAKLTAYNRLTYRSYIHLMFAWHALVRVLHRTCLADEACGRRRQQLA